MTKVVSIKHTIFYIQFNVKFSSYSQQKKNILILKASSFRNSLHSSLLQFSRLKFRKLLIFVHYGDESFLSEILGEGRIIADNQQKSWISRHHNGRKSHGLPDRGNNVHSNQRLALIPMIEMIESIGDPKRSVWLWSLWRTPSHYIR